MALTSEGRLFILLIKDLIQLLQVLNMNQSSPRKKNTATAAVKKKFKSFKTAEKKIFRSRKRG